MGAKILLFCSPRAPYLEIRVIFYFNMCPKLGINTNGCSLLTIVYPERSKATSVQNRYHSVRKCKNWFDISGNTQAVFTFPDRVGMWYRGSPCTPPAHPDQILTSIKRCCCVAPHCQYTPDRRDDKRTLRYRVLACILFLVFIT